MGDPHPTDSGKVFLSYHPASRGGGEYWVTAEQLEERRREIQEYAARRRAENPEACREREARRRAANAEKIKESQARYRAANAGRAKERDARWHATNRERSREIKSAWAKRNPEVCRARRTQRRARERSATHPDHSIEIETVLFQSAERLGGCLGIKFHIDHIIPLDRGGPHHHANLRILPARLNLIKNNRLDSELPSHLQTVIKQWSPYLN